MQLQRNCGGGHLDGLDRALEGQGVVRRHALEDHLFIFFFIIIIIIIIIIIRINIEFLSSLR